MVAINCGDRACTRVRYVVTHAVIPWYRRVSGISVLFENSGTSSAGTQPRVREWCDHRWNEARPGSRDAWRRLVDSELWLATSLPGNWFGEPWMVACLD